MERELESRDVELKRSEAKLRRFGAELARASAALPEWHAALASRDRRVEELDGVTHYLARLVVERDRELLGLRAELAALGQLDADIEAIRFRDEEGARALERLQRQVAEIGAQARGQATRIRMQALRQAVQLASRLDGGREVAGVNGVDPAGSGMNGGGWSGNGAVGRFEGTVHLDVGPLRDFSQLVRFEDAVIGIGATSEISVKRFSKGRATLALRLDRPVELLRELEERAPFEIRVRSLKDDRLIVDVDER